MAFRYDSRGEYEHALEELLRQSKDLEGDERDQCDDEYDKLLDEYVDFCVALEESSIAWN